MHGLRTHGLRTGAACASFPPPHQRPLLALTHRSYSQEGAYYVWSRVEFLAEELKEDLHQRAVYCSNCAASLHQLGSWDEAIEGYRRAIALFEQCRPQGRLSRWVQGGAVDTRIQFVESRIQLAAHGQMPKVGEYLDGSCKVRDDGKEVNGPASTRDINRTE